ncbi:MAG: prolipoprotein diacylglyceryl transferase [Kiritimatiellaeota bacterium]|nr:prolipoprotein diacylglyceryl transferase [Kiritimatiellota bacterium]
MHSELFSIGPITLRMYGLCMALGFLAAWRVMVYLCKRTGQNSDQVAMLLTWVMLAAILGARAVYVAQHWTAEFAHNPLAVVRFDQGGLVYYGGFLGALIPYIGYALRFRRNFFEMTDISAAVLPLGQAFGRVGCFMQGCCWGKHSDAWLTVSFPRGSPAWFNHVSGGLIRETATESLSVIPTQLIESAATLALFALLFALYPKHYRRRGLIGGLYLVGYAVLRFGIEFLRGDPRGAVGPFSTSQAISLAAFIGGLACIAWAGKGKGAVVSD